MNREILFRGKAINRNEDMEYRTNYKNGDWVYGLISKPHCELFPELPAEMINTNGVSGIEVDYTTIGEYTGLIDKNGVKIFEGDILRHETGTLHKVVFEQRNGNAYFGWVMDEHETWHFDSVFLRQLEVIGNIYDNPELLKGE